jgi:uncharacterized protein
LPKERVISSHAEPVAVAAPLAKGERIAALDIIRGFAVLGILLANITAFSHPALAYYWPPALPGGAQAADGWIWLGQFVLVDGKLRGLFTILFGAGMLLFIERANADGGEGGAKLQLRRLAWLALFGLAHFYLLFPGDVLWSYATSGMLCLLCLRLRTAQLLALGIGGSLLGGLLLLADFGPPALIERLALAGGAVPAEWPALQKFWADRLADSGGEVAAMGGASFAALLHYRWEEDSWRLGLVFTYNFLETIPLVLLGMGLFRAGVFTDAGLRRRWRPLAWAAALLGAGLNLAAGLHLLRAGFPPFQTQAAFFALLPLFNLPLLLGASVLLTDWALAIRSGWLGEQLGPAGRMAFSNYIGTSLVMALVFQGWAGGLFGTMHRAELLVVVVIGWAMMLTASRLWLAHYRHGPLEWLWRCLTYGRLFPNRI